MKVASYSLVMMFARVSTGLNFPARPFRAFTQAARAVSGSAHSRTLTTLASTVVSRPAGIDVSEPPVQHEAYELLRDEMVEEYGVRTTLYKHVKSGAEVLSVVADDENKVFGITFRTPPKDSTGVPHILEHSVLCGSRKYKSKEPFVELLKGSLQTFLNAFTYPDRTCYPVASCNLKDFYNLVNVYLDAVLHPRALSDPLVLKQEGWHFELEDPKEPLTYKGVVYNEMKGVYSSPDSVLGRAAQQALFKTNTYAVDSGGDPLVIPDLTYDGFKNFHGEFYHPSNSRVFFYGDDPVPARLELLDEYLSEFNAISPDSAIAFEPLRDLVAETQGKRVVEKFPAAPQAEGSEGKAQNMVQVNWLLNEKPFSAKEALTLAVLDHLLMGTQSATLRKALTDSGLGSEVIGGGMDDTLNQATFSAGLKGIKPENADGVEKLVLSTLEEFAAAGPEEDAVAASLNSIEFSLREFNTGSFPRGLSFMLGAMNEWLFDRDPLEGLRFEAPLQALKDDLAAGKPVFSEMVKALLLENKHRVGVEMVPDPTLEAAQVEEETNRLAALKAAMSEDDIAKVMAETEELKAAQAAHDSPEDLATIPSLGLEDLSKEQLELPNDVTLGEGGSAAVLRHEVPSNGILYLDIGLDLTVLDAADLPLVSLFSRALTSTGTDLGDEVALSRRIGAKTGGLGASTFTGVKTPADDTVATGDDLVHRLFLRGKVVMSRPEDLFDIALDVLTSAKLDNKKRLVEMLKESEARVEASLVSAGHSYASTRLGAASSVAGALSEVTGGASYLATLRELLKQAETDFPALQARLEGIRSKLLCKERLLVNLSGDKATLAAAEPALDAFLAAFPAGPSEGVASQLEAWKKELAPLPSVSEGFVVPTQVNYVGKGGKLYSPGEKVTGASMVVARALRTGYLWDTVRVMGGAYGGFCRFSPLTGSFAYLSYRDPNLLGTIKNYDGAAGFLASTGGPELTDEALAQAIIGAVGDLDGPLSPDAKGYEAMRRWLVEESAEQRAAWRAEVMATTREDFTAFGARLAAAHEDAMHSVVFGSKQALEDANAELAKANKPQFVLKELL